MTDFPIGTLESLQRLCDNHAQESSQLEFKRFDLVRDKNGKQTIAKEVCGFANSIGGQLILGLSEDKRCADHIDAGWATQEGIAAWLEDVIRSNVKPQVDFVVVPIVLRTGNEVYVVNIDQGYTAHQSSDLKFYRCRQLKTEPMDYQEIEDVKARRTRPSVSIDLEVVPNSVSILSHPHTSVSESVSVFFAVQNRSNVLIEYLQLHVWMPLGMFWDPEEELGDWHQLNSGRLPDEFGAMNKRGFYMRYILQMSPSTGFFLMESPLPLDLSPVSFRFRPFRDPLPLPWMLEVPCMESKIGSLLLNLDGSPERTFSAK